MSYVKKLRAVLVDTNSPLARQVLVVDLLDEDEGNALIKEIERKITLP